MIEQTQTLEKDTQQTNNIEKIHAPVLLQQCLDFLAPAIQNKPKAYMIDATLGMAGHTYHALEKFPNLHVIGIDRDLNAIEIAKKRTQKYKNRITIVHATYDQINKIAKQLIPDGKADAILMDLGVSSLQLDDDQRGFSYARNVELDMRMDKTNTLDAKQILQTYTTEELTKILYLYGEEKYAKKIAKTIVQERENTPITHSNQLNELIRNTLPAAVIRTGKNPCKKTYQALRIEVNQELQILKQALPNALSTLTVGGIIAIESYHSLEDRMVKTIFNQGATTHTPIDIPIIPEEDKPYLKLVTKKAIKADQTEIQTNTRSQSVRLRVAQKIRENNNVAWRIK